jgi:hypothetical protein
MELKGLRFERRQFAIRAVKFGMGGHGFQPVDLFAFVLVGADLDFVASRLFGRTARDRAIERTPTAR